MLLMGLEFEKKRVDEQFVYYHHKDSGDVVANVKVGELVNVLVGQNEVTAEDDSRNNRSAVEEMIFDEVHILEMRIRVGKKGQHK